MNQAPSGYSQYPPVPQHVGYTYPTNPYPTQQQTPYPAYAAAQQQQAQQGQYFQALPQQGSIPSQHQTPVQHTPTPQAPQRRQASASRHAQPERDGEAPAGPGAPPPEDVEEQLRNALQSQNANAHVNDEHDDDEDDDADGGDGDENEPVFNLPPPPEGTYASCDELEKTMHAWSLEHGYEVVRRASKKNAAGTIYKRYYHCSKHGKLANTGKLTDAMRKRPKRQTNRQNCPMSLAAVSADPSNPAGEWQIRHRKTHHNHGPLDALSLAGHRRRARMGGVEKAVDGLFAIGTPTTQVLQFLQRTNPEGLFTRTDVANMKLKHKKYGTCVHLPNQFSRDPEKALAGRSACNRCREKKTRCDAVRPICQTCASLPGVQCVYDHDQAELGAVESGSPSGTPLQDETPIALDSVPNQFQTPTPTITTGGPRSKRPQTQLSVQRAAAEQILQDLQSFHAEHVKPKRLELNASSVEILANSSCGNGDTYKSIPTLITAADWQSWSDAFLAASRTENTMETLVGAYSEPVRPVPSEEGGGVDVDDWNEYVKASAIFKRRNGLLLGCMWTSLAPSFRTRIQGIKTAVEAWRALEEMCAPKGSSEAFRTFDDLMSVTLESCGGVLSEYIARLETAHKSFARLKMSLQFPHDRTGRQRTDLTPVLQHQQHTYAGGQGKTVSVAGTGANAVGEDLLAFIFLRGLGERYGKWTEQLLLTNNVAGFGTGPRIGFRELGKRAREWEGVQGRRG